MPEGDLLLDRLASAVADREEVDWRRARSSVIGDRAAARAAALELIGARAARAASTTAASAVSEVSAPGAARFAWAVAAVAAAQLLLAFAPTAWAEPPPGLPRSLMLLVAVGFASAGGVLLTAGRRDPRARDLGAFFFCVASALSMRYLPLEAPWPGVAAVALVAATFVPDAFLPYFLWRFVRRFPRVVRFERAADLATVFARVSLALGVILVAANALAALPPVARVAALEPLVHTLERGRVGGIYWLVISLLCLPAPVTAWWRARRAERRERLRVRWFLGGLAAGILPLFLAVLAEVLVPPFARWVSQPQVRLASGVFLFTLLATIPVTSSYAVLAHRILELRFVLRGAIAFALARGSVITVASVPTLVLAYQLWLRRHLPLSIALAAREVTGWALAAAAGWLLFALRGLLLARLQRWLVGSREEAARGLAAFAERMRGVADPLEVNQLVAEHLGHLVAASSGTVLLAGSDTDTAEGGAAGGEGAVAVSGELPPLAADSGLLRIAHDNVLPFAVGEEERPTLDRWLVAADREWVRQAGAALLAPLLDSSGSLLGVLTVGPTRGGTPYDERDRQSIAAVATTTALAVERLARASRVADGGARSAPAGECLWCGRVGPRSGVACECGAELDRAAIPYELAGKFRLQAVLGAGGMGVVYRAIDIDLHRPVALKTLPRLKGGALERLRREARSMASFVHPNLALIFGVETWDDVPVLVVEYLGGGTLDDRLPPGLPVREALELAIAMAGALDAMHRQGLLHRDVKPANIGFTTGGVPKLLDFGLAHLTGDVEIPALDGEAPWEGELRRLTQSGKVVGTPLYLSPEVLRGRQPTPAQDLWSLHLVLWECLTGRHPLADVETETALRRLGRGELPFEELARQLVPVPVTGVLERGLDADPRRRPAMAREVQAALLAAVEQLAECPESPRRSSLVGEDGMSSPDDLETKGGAK
ncbi:MAG TPA: serine/threonine-protein kinase [Thermoanaerobaculia bacterium]|nr:serine/threonine-protein kinase [Thermoanaerobaculia bacterium]